MNTEATRMIITQTATEAWEMWYKELEDMHKQNFHDSSRDGAVVGEILNAITRINDPTRNIVESDIRKLNKRYMVGELLWYLSANNNLSEIQKYTSAWDRMSEDGVTVNSNYGHKIHKFYGFDQWEFVRDMLKKDPKSRQAVIHIKDPGVHPKDTPCTVCLQFFIRDNKLHLTVYMRSNDIWMGFPYDVFIFTCYQIRMAMELGVDLGTYTHIAGSLHLYERNSRLKKEPEKTKTALTRGEIADLWLVGAEDEPLPVFAIPAEYLKTADQERGEAINDGSTSDQKNLTES